jgi:inositol-phosphate transport system substrate-binding protein
VLAHEWTGAFAESGYALNLEDHITKNPELYGDIIVPLWQSVSYKGARYGVPQDSEIRMYFLNNDKLRKLGKTDKEIAAIPAKVDAGEFTAYDLCDLSGQAVTKRVTKFGILHRPNAGPDFQMMMEGFGHVPYDKTEAKLQASKVAMKDFFAWVKYCVDKKAFSSTNTSMSWDAIEQTRLPRKRRWCSSRRVARDRQSKAWNLKAGRLQKITWINAGGQRAASRPTCRTDLVLGLKSKNRTWRPIWWRWPSRSQHAACRDDNHTPIRYGQ